MNISQQLKEFEDPLFDRMKSTDKPETRQKVTETVAHAESRGKVLLILVIALAVGLSFLGYHLVQAQQGIDQLTTNLTDSRSQLTMVTHQLEDSQGRLGTLEQDVSRGRSQL